MKALAAALAVLMCALVVSSASSGAPSTTATKKAKSKITLLYTSSGAPPYGESFFSGKVKGKKACRKKRKVSVAGFKVKTNKKGAYSVTLAAPAAPGTYVAKVKKKKAKKGKTVFKCSKAKSKPVVVP